MKPSCGSGGESDPCTLISKIEHSLVMTDNCSTYALSMCWWCYFVDLICFDFKS